MVASLNSVACAARFPARFRAPVVIKILRGDHFSHESSVRLESLFDQLFEHKEIQICREDQLHFSEIGSTQVILVLPGSADVKTWNFPERQQKHITELCKIGALKVVAVCAGAYFLSDTIIYKEEEKVHAHRHMSLFSGKCIGPVYTQEKSALPIQLTSVYIQSQRVEVVLNRGGYFLPSSQLRHGMDYEVLARYDALDGRIAALACVPFATSTFYNAILIGPHFEYEPGDLDNLARALPPSYQEQLREMTEKIHMSALGRLCAMQSFLAKMGCT